MLDNFLISFVSVRLFLLFLFCSSFLPFLLSPFPSFPPPAPAACLSLRVNRDVKPLVEKGAECGIRLSAGSDALVAVGDVIVCASRQKKKKVLDDSAARGFIGEGKGDLNQQLANFYDK